jgi:hypothetical protein
MRCDIESGEMNMFATERSAPAAHPPGLTLLSERVRREFEEMPGLRLTLCQAQRLWSEDRRTCGVVLDGLVTRGFLKRNRSGVYSRDGAEDACRCPVAP